MSENLPPSFRERLHDAMLSKGIEVNQICEAIGVQRSTITQILYGSTHCPNAETAYKLAKYLHVPVEYFFNDEPPSLPIKESSNKALIKKKEIPVLEFSLIPFWFSKNEVILTREDIQWIHSDEETPPLSFAVKSNIINNPTFPKDSILIAYPRERYYPNDYVLASINNRKPSIRLIIEESEFLYLSSVVGQLRPDPLNDSANIFGKIVKVISTHTKTFP